MIHDFSDFTSMHQTKRTTGYGEILRVNTYRFSIDCSGTDDDTITMKNFLIHIKIFGLMLNEHVVLMERVFVQNCFNTLPGCQFSHCSLLLNRLFATSLKNNFFSLS